MFASTLPLVWNSDAQCVVNGSSSFCYVLKFWLQYAQFCLPRIVFTGSKINQCESVIDFMFEKWLCADYMTKLSDPRYNLLKCLQLIFYCVKAIWSHFPCQTQWFQVQNWGNHNLLSCSWTQVWNCGLQMFHDRCVGAMCKVTLWHVQELEDSIAQQSL